MNLFGFVFLIPVPSAGAGGEPAPPEAHVPGRGGAPEVRLSDRAEGIPHSARRFDLRCAACHLSPPKLDEYGEEFVRRNYRLPDPADREERWTPPPLAIWVSSRADLQPDPADLTKDEGLPEPGRDHQRVPALLPWLSCVVEWRPVRFELRADGTLRDRSGRFEDLLLTA